MHRKRCYDTCQRYFGKVVRIEDRDGRIHLGKIIDVTNDSVWIEPMQQRSSLIQDSGTITHIQTADVIFAVVLADVITVDLDAVVDSMVDLVAVDAAVVVAVVVAAVAGALNSDLALFLELLWLHYFSSNIVKS